MLATEKDFRRALANRTDWSSRLAFADWLRDRNDPRAEGYFAMAVLRLSPVGAGADAYAWWCNAGAYPEEDKLLVPRAFLPADWFELIDLPPNKNKCKPIATDPTSRNVGLVEDAAALAFKQLSPARRAELLCPVLTEAP